MPRHREVKRLSITSDKLYDLVSDVRSYPEFLPWCVGAVVHSQTEECIIADLKIGYKFFQEGFTSEVKLTPKSRIDVRYTDGPFKYLENHWIFRPTEDGGTEIEFYVDFEFKSFFMQNLIELLFTEAVHKMVVAFEKRAEEVYIK
ncbi:MAG: type II toxin-antitoxin system RatA family toxin [Alphaproteobacteria bacterium]|nr:type II toxin-antitoxin system RatA family toxin [Alphaproteobacteria bacterium]OJV46803.1 MAG: ubiquinone-binding protein [Alphaproteobacteria bacterium 43-37]